MNTQVKKACWGSVCLAAKIIKKGGIVAFPTETVYGLGANGFNEAACSKIYEIKGRPADNPLILHVCNEEQLSKISKDYSSTAKKLMDKFWPGPLTVILQNNFAPRGTNLQTVAVRMPKNPYALLLISLANVPIAAPSANLSGRPSPTTAAHVVSDLDGKIELVLDAGQCEYGLESTVIDCTSALPTILRPGSITKEMLEAEIGEIACVSAFSGTDEILMPRSPGMKYKHYAPKARLVIVSGKTKSTQIKITELAASSKHAQIGILAHTHNAKYYQNLNAHVLPMGQNTAQIAANLFSVLRKCDDLKLEEVFVEAVDEVGLGYAIMERLKKAASYNIVEV